VCISWTIEFLVLYNLVLRISSEVFFRILFLSLSVEYLEYTEKSNEVRKIALTEFEKCVYYICTRVLVSSVTGCKLLIVSYLAGYVIVPYSPHHTSFGQ